MTDTAPSQDVLFRLGGVGVVETHMPTGQLVRANQTFCDLLGYSEAELQRMTYLELTHPGDRGRDAASFAALGLGEIGESRSLTRLLCRDGSTVWLELYVTLIRDGGRTRNLTVATDMTERERAKAALEELNETLERRVAARTDELARSNARFAQAFYANPVPACMTTFGRETFIEVNDAFLELTGYARDEVVGRASRDLGMWSSPEDQKKMGAAQRGGAGFRNLELGLRAKDGGHRTVLMSAEVIGLDGHEGFLKIFFDVTEQQRTLEQTHRAIREVLSDTSWFSQRVIERLAHIKAGSAEVFEAATLSRREREVLRLLAGGLNNDAIAAELGVATQTVRNYVATVYDKLGVHTRAEAIVWARERGIV